MRDLSRRQLLAGGLGVAGGVVTAGTVGAAWTLLAREDLIPGEPVERRLEPAAWTTTADRLVFAALGDSGSGGRQAVAVADRMAQTYAEAPFGVVAHLGDLCYYGPIVERFDDVFIRPMQPLIDAGVEFELAIGNHDGALHDYDRTLAEIEATLTLLGVPARYYWTAHGPVDFFFLDSSPAATLGSTEQFEWLDDALASATRPWRIVALHHPLYSSGRHGSTVPLRELLEPILVRHHVDLVLAGHDHHYERTEPIHGITHVVSGGGCKTTAVDPLAFTAFAASALEFLHVTVDGDRLEVRAIRPRGTVLDRFELRARDRR